MTKKDFDGYNPDYIVDIQYAVEIETENRAVHKEVMVKVLTVWSLIDRTGDESFVEEGSRCQDIDYFKEIPSATGMYGGNWNNIENIIVRCTEHVFQEFRCQFCNKISAGGTAVGGMKRGDKTIVRFKVARGAKFQPGQQMCLMDEDGFKLGIGTVTGQEGNTVSLDIWKWLGNKRDKFYVAFRAALEDRSSSAAWFEENTVRVLTLGYHQPRNESFSENDFTRRQK